MTESIVRQLESAGLRVETHETGTFVEDCPQARWIICQHPTCRILDVIQPRHREPEHRDTLLEITS